MRKAKGLPAPQKRIFISYRRSDSAGYAGRIYDYLKSYFGEDRLFFDVDTIKPGTNFKQRIVDELDNSDAALVLIANQWLDARGKDGSRRLDNPDDYVRFEIETALNKNITVLPVLLQGAPMPPASQLPESLSELSTLNAIRLNDDHWSSNCSLLAGILKSNLHVSRSLKQQQIRKYRVYVFILTVVGSLLAVLYGLTEGFRHYGFLVSTMLRVILALSVIGNVALITYLLGNLKKELDRLSWAIIGLAILGSLLVAMGDDLDLNLIPWSAVTLVLVAGLLTFVEPDE